MIKKSRKNIINYFRFDFENFSLKFMTSNFLKIIAVISMFIDHYAFLVLNPSTDLYEIMRIIGRIAFVTYAFLSCVAVYNTRKPILYLARTLIMAVLFQIFIGIATNFTSGLQPYYLNIFFVIFFGTFTIHALRKHVLFGFLAFIASFLFYFFYIDADLLFGTTRQPNMSIDYALYGYFIILAMGICFYFQKQLVPIMFKIIIIGVFIIISIMFHNIVITNIYFSRLWNIGSVQIYSLMTIPLFLFYNQKDHYKNKFVKWSFVSAYPLSFIIPSLILLAL